MVTILLGALAHMRTFLIARHRLAWNRAPFDSNLPFINANSFVPAALVLSAESEAELAGMLSHALVHAAAHNSVIRLDGVTTIPIVYVGGTFGWDGKGDPLLPLRVASLQQERELEADTMVAHVMATAGLDPNALLRYIERTQRDVGSRSSKYDALPPRTVRLATLTKVVEGLSFVATVPSSSSFTESQNSLRLVKAGNTQPQKIPSLKHR